MRPLPPFKVKPLKTVTVRRIMSADAIRDLIEPVPTCIRPARATMRLTKPMRKATLRILGRPGNDTH